MHPIPTRLLLLAIPLLTQPVAAQEEAFTEHLNVNLVTVDVVVEDRNGNPVTGLTASDFEVLEDGRPVAIQHFSEVGVVPPATQSVSGASAAATEDDLTSATRQEQPPLHVVIYIDDANLHPLNRRKVLPHLKTWLHHLPDQARVMVVRAYRSAEVVLPFTASRHHAADALEELTRRFGGRGQVAGGRQELLNNLYSERTEGLLRSEVFSYTESVYHDTADSLRTLADVIGEIGGLPGRKAVLYVSDGISIRPGEELFEVLEEQFADSVSRMRADDYDLSREFLRLSREAASSRIILSSVDAAGLRPPSNADVAAYRAGRSSAADSIYVSNLEASLQMMARETGGKAITNTNLMSEGLRKAADSLSHYYELAYTAPRVGSGRFRDIEIEVLPQSGNKLRVRHRRGYRDIDSRQQVEAALRAALSFGYADNPLDLDLTASVAERNGETSQVPLTIHVPLANLTMIPGDVTTSGKVTVFLGVRDTDGQFSPIEHFQHPITISRQALDDRPDSTYQLKHTVGLKPGRQSLAIAVRDDLSAEHSIVLGAIDA